MNYTTPKVDWAAGDNPGPSDFNRIEKNIGFLLIQQPLNVGTFSGSFPSTTGDTQTLFEYTVPLYGVGAIKVVPATPAITFVSSVGDATYTISLLVNGSSVGSSGVTVSADYTVTVQVTASNWWTSGTHADVTYSFDGWVTNKYTQV